jgi:hypothetical protein
MRRSELERLVARAKCRVVGAVEASNEAHRAVLATVIKGFGNSDATILCEPSLARSTKRPPDIAIIHSILGVHFIEVKGHSLDRIDGIEIGGAIRFKYLNKVVTKNPVAQIRSAMFAAKNATQEACLGELVVPFQHWVIFPNIERDDWLNRWREAAPRSDEFVFGKELADLPKRILHFGRGRLSNAGLAAWPSDQLDAVMLAFGDTSVLHAAPEDREARRVKEGTLGEQFDDAAETYKTLSDEQVRLSSLDWTEGPRLVRGVAGSGKTIVLANSLARRLASFVSSVDLFEHRRPQRTLVVCNNRSLVPYLTKKVGLAFEQRTGEKLDERCLEITSFNRLMYKLSKAGLWTYQSYESGTDEARAANYLKELTLSKKTQQVVFDELAYDAIYVDEGQDFHEQQYRLLIELCRVTPGTEPNLYVFYDDAQNFLGQARPNWLSLGLNVRGKRAHVMSQCFRNTRPIVEAAFNVLYGTAANGQGEVPTKDFGDVAGLEEKGLVLAAPGYWQVKFAMRSGHPPRLTLTDSKRAENKAVIKRLRWLIEEQQVRPQDILVLDNHGDRILEIAKLLRSKPIRGVSDLHIATQEKDLLLGRRSLLTLATTIYAKGYDAYCVLLVSGNEFPRDLSNRVRFYVGCTRAIEYLEVFGYSREGLFLEWEQVLAKQSQLTDPAIVDATIVDDDRDVLYLK